VRSASVIAALRSIGGLWRLPAALLWLFPRPLRDRLYDAVARRRYRWFGRFETCRLPTTDEADRFLP
jgi:predicted DCC family thiol-disulfide oxidoreductase YuxK